MSSINNYVVILPGDGWGGRGGQKKVGRFLCSDLGGRAGGLKDHTWCSSRYWRRPSLPLGVTNLLGDLGTCLTSLMVLKHFLGVKELLSVSSHPTLTVLTLLSVAGEASLHAALSAGQGDADPLGLGPAIPLHLVAADALHGGVILHMSVF